MCYFVYLSTNSNEDLSKLNSELLSFEKECTNETALSLLEYDNKWYVGSKSKCSCTLRHLMSVELGFSEPEDWYEEKEDEILATLSFIHIVRKMIDDNKKIDCIDVWYNAKINDIVSKDVNISEINNKQFRFYENYYFTFYKNNN